MNSPYEGLPPRAFWRQGVAERTVLDGLFEPRFQVSRTDRIATAGSCFAQHVGRTLREQGFNVIDAEPLPEGADAETASRFGYGLFSGRYANIYTTRQLAQLLDEANGDFVPALPVWEKSGRYFDAQRPGVEPDGLDSPEDVMELRAHHLERVRSIFAEADVFVFTFGLTEAFIHRETGTVYPTAPGTIAGQFDPDVFEFRNFTYPEILADFLKVRSRLKAINPKMRFVVTVSPVPLTATASGEHVEVATTYSKAVLRAVAGHLYHTLDDLDYFPSYEIITSQKAGGAFYETNLRSVSSVGVQTAMSVFMRAQGVDMATPATQPSEQKPKRKTKVGPPIVPRTALFSEEERRARRAAGLGPFTAEERRARRMQLRTQIAPVATEQEDDVVCEDALLEAFNK